MRARTAAVLGLLLIAGGALFGSPSLYPAGVALLVLPLAAVLWVLLAGARVRIERLPPEGPLLEGRAYPFELRLRFGLLPPPAGELRDPLLPAPLPLRARTRTLSLPAELRFERRGRRSLGAAELLIRDPFGLAERRLRSPEAGEVVVLPRTEPLELGPRGAGGRALGLGERGAGGSGPDSWASEFEIDGLRPYRRGSPAARIHWPAVARTGELHERRITSGADVARLVVLDPQRPASQAALDAAVRAAASICRELGSAGGCALLVGGERRPIEIEPRARGFEQAHHLLALVEPGAGPPSVHRIAQAGLVLWVSGDPGGGPEQRLQRLPAARKVLVRPAPSGSGAALFRVAGCEARELGRPVAGRRRRAAA